MLKVASSLALLGFIFCSLTQIALSSKQHEDKTLSWDCFTDSLLPKSELKLLYDTALASRKNVAEAINLHLRIVSSVCVGESEVDLRATNQRRYMVPVNNLGEADDGSEISKDDTPDDGRVDTSNVVESDNDSTAKYVHGSLYELSLLLLEAPWAAKKPEQWPSFLLTHINVTSVLDNINPFANHDHIGIRQSSMVSVGIVMAWNSLILSAELGNANGQHVLATAYSTGIFGGYLVPMDPVRAVYLEELSALSGNVLAHMGMGYRYLKGLVVTESCERALGHYEFAANHVIQQIGTGEASHIELGKLSEVDLAVSGTHHHIDNEMIEYYISVAQDGDAPAAWSLYNIYHRGSRLIDPNPVRAMHYLHRAVQLKSASANGALGYEIVKDSVIPIPASTFAIAKEYLNYGMSRGDPTALVGMAYAHMVGIEGMETNISYAKSLLLRVLSKHQDAGYYLAELIMNNQWSDPQPANPETHVIEKQVSGGGPAASPSQVDAGSRPASPVVVSALENLAKELLAGDTTKATTMVVEAAGLQLSGSVTDAFNFYLQSVQRGQSSQAIHRLSYMFAYGLGTARSCNHAVRGFRTIAERGEWMHGLLMGHRAYDKAAWREAIGHFAALSAVGVEIAQNNAAHIMLKRYSPLPLFESVANEQDDDAVASVDLLSSTTSAVRMPPVSLKEKTLPSLIVSDQTANPNDVFVPLIGKTDNSESLLRALYLYGMAADQGSGESLLRIGDIHYYGSARLPSNKASAAKFYQMAADKHLTQALFNLGVMHQAGDGIPQDLHLAKRFYDSARDLDSNAQLPSSVALTFLQGQRKLHQWLGPQRTQQLVAGMLDIGQLFIGWLAIVRELAIDNAYGAPDSSRSVFSSITKLVVGSKEAVAKFEEQTEFGYGYGPKFSNHHYEDHMNRTKPVNVVSLVRKLNPQVGEDSNSATLDFFSYQLRGLTALLRRLNRWLHVTIVGDINDISSASNITPARTWVGYFKGVFPWLWSVSDHTLAALVVLFMVIYTVRRRRRRMRFAERMV